MHANLFHVFRNTPLGRETLMQSLYFCRTLDVGLTLYIPDAVRFMMYFDQDAVQVDLDRSYLNEPETATERALALAAEAGLKPRLLRPKNRTASDLPDIPTHFAFHVLPAQCQRPLLKNWFGVHRAESQAHHPFGRFSRFADITGIQTLEKRRRFIRRVGQCVECASIGHSGLQAVGIPAGPVHSIRARRRLL